jgi:hypothetical protein
MNELINISEVDDNGVETIINDIVDTIKDTLDNE